MRHVCVYVCDFSGLLNNISLAVDSIKIKRKVREGETETENLEVFLELLVFLDLTKQVFEIKVLSHLCSSSLVLRSRESPIEVSSMSHVNRS